MVFDQMNSFIFLVGQFYGMTFPFDMKDKKCYLFLTELLIDESPSHYYHLKFSVYHSPFLVP